MQIATDLLNQLTECLSSKENAQYCALSTLNAISANPATAAVYTGAAVLTGALVLFHKPLLNMACSLVSSKGAAPTSSTPAAAGATTAAATDDDNPSVGMRKK